MLGLYTSNFGSDLQNTFVLKSIQNIKIEILKSREI